MTHPPLVLIVGMHRSGTSLLGNLLSSAGVSLPGPLIAGDQHNPEGYFERADITDLQERLLIALDRWWPSAQGTLPLPADWLCRGCTHSTLDQLHALLLRDSAEQSSPWAIKDPRTSLLLPLWRRLTGELQIPLRLILAVRHPAEVVQSLCQRDGDAAGMTAQRAELLWWRHNQAVLDHAHGLPLEVVDYGQWFGPGQAPALQLQRLWQFCGLPKPGLETLRQCLAQIKPEHRRSADAATSVVLDESTKALHRALVTGELIEAARAERPYRVHLPISSGEQNSPTHLGGWFDPSFYQRQYPDLADLSTPLDHYINFGWREGRQPHPLFDPGHYLQSCLQRGLMPPGYQSPLQHFQNAGIAAGIVPTPVHDAEWWSHQQGQLQLAQAPALTALHPWGGAALALADHDLSSAVPLLLHWQRHGISSADWRTLQRGSAPWLRWPSNPPVTGQSTGSAPAALSSSGISLNHWLAQGWLAALAPLPPGQRLHLVLLSPGEQLPESDIQALSRIPGLVMADPDPQRCSLWQHLGLNWILLQWPTDNQLASYLAAEPWLAMAEERLGLPPPAALAGRTLITLGPGGPEWDSRNDHSDHWCLPGFDDLVLDDPDATRSLASWLWHCDQQGLNLVRLSAATSTPSHEQALGWLPITWMCVQGLTPAALQWELSWRREGRPAPPAPVTPQPEATVVWEGGHGHASTPAQVAVVVSLYNYAERIEEALNSVASQDLPALELIVVDDASTDSGIPAVQSWLEQHGQLFQRARLLRHGSNAGLAAARNTAFAATEAPWCLVLDADNALLPQAASTLLAVAQQGSDALAVVHPLIEQEVEQPNGGRHTTGLHNALSWQQTLFAQRREGNYIDAMALVRRSAWQAVGGYVHIPGGWEDFDFWCLLIEAGFHGVLCPAVLAQYRCHTSSMLRQSTHANVRRISRLLQHRHPWLQLQLGQPDF